MARKKNSRPELDTTLISPDLIQDGDFVANASPDQLADYQKLIGNAWAEEACKPVKLDNYTAKKDIPQPPVPPYREPIMVEKKVKGKGKKTESQMVMNDRWCDWMEGIHSTRAAWMQTMIDPRRDLDGECGYPSIILPRQYRYMYDREGIASRVVSIYPDECWAMTPHVFETDDPSKITAFEEDWEILCESAKCNPLHYLHRVDTLSRIGRYGTLLIGTDDDNAEDLSKPVPGVDPAAGERKRDYEILFIRPFDEMFSWVINFDRDPASDRFCQPLYYHMMFADPNGGTGIDSTTSVASRVVHWSRVLHFADNREGSEVFGVPSQRNVFNRLCDCRKILGGSAEMFWKGGFPGYAFELDPSLINAGVAPDPDTVKHQMDMFSNSLQRYISVVGLHVNSLAPQVADPNNHLAVNLNAIAMSVGVPLRTFMGSEQGQLAASQDIKNWNRRLGRRNTRYLTPLMLRPFIDRMLQLGVLRAPAKGRYKVEWPDINVPSEIERADIADKMTAGLMKYIIGGVYQVIPPLEYFTQILGLPEAKAKILEAAAKKWMASPGFKIKNPNEKPVTPAGGGAANKRGTGVTNTLLMSEITEAIKNIQSTPVNVTTVPGDTSSLERLIANQTVVLEKLVDRVNEKATVPVPTPPAAPPVVNVSLPQADKKKTTTKKVKRDNDGRVTEIVEEESSGE